MIFFKWAIFFNTLRDMCGPILSTHVFISSHDFLSVLCSYEAYVLWLFFKLLLQFADGSETLSAKLEKVPQMKYSMPFCCFHIKPGRIFLHRCQQMILQFVYVKLGMTATILVTELLDVYGEGSFAVNRAYLWVTIVYNITITISLYFLVLFYEATKEILAEYKPIAKFLTVKAIIFFSFWQSVAVAVAMKVGVVRDYNGFPAAEMGLYIQDVLICIEMVPIAIAMGYTFGYSTFKKPKDQREELQMREIPRRIIDNFIDMANFVDVIRDTADAVRKEPERRVVAGQFLDMPLDEQQKQILEQGWLSKKGDDLAKLWQKRFCAVIKEPLGLVYFRSNPYDVNAAAKGKPAEPRGFIDFKEVSAVYAKRPMGFNLVTGARTWRFNAFSVAERDHWLKSLQTVIDNMPRSDDPVALGVDSELSAVPLDEVSLDGIGSSPSRPPAVSRVATATGLSADLDAGAADNDDEYTLDNI
jgi:hypothetical protein